MSFFCTINCPIQESITGVNYHIEFAGSENFIRRSKCESKLNILQQRRTVHVDLGTRLVMHGLVPVFAIMTRIIQPKARIVGDSLYDFIARPS